MDGNRDIFPLFLHIAIYVVFMILTSFGLLGYLRYGDHVQQIVIRSIPQHSVLAIMVDVTLVVSVLCTYPLQCFPVIQIMEGYIFGPGRVRKVVKKITRPMRYIICTFMTDLYVFIRDNHSCSRLCSYAWRHSDI